MEEAAPHGNDVTGGEDGSRASVRDGQSVNPLLFSDHMMGILILCPLARMTLALIIPRD